MHEEERIDERHRYFAFVAYTRYKRKDFKYAEKIYKELQKHRLPAKIAKKYPEKHKRTKPLFLDHFDMPPENYNRIDPLALKESKKLIVVCSTRLVEHETTAVIKEIQDFLDSGHDWDDIIPVLVEKPNKKEDRDARVQRCFPKILRELNAKNNGEYNKIAVDFFKPSGKKDVESVIYKMISYIQGINLTELERFERKRKRMRMIFGSLLCAVLILLGVLLMGWTSEKINIKNGIQEAINVSENNTYNAITSLFDIEKRQNRFLLNNERVYSALEAAADYKAGQCLRKKQFYFNNIESIEVVNKVGNLFGVKTTDRYYVIDVNDCEIKYEISANNFWYEKENKKYQMVLNNDATGDYELQKVWCDNDKVYLSIAPPNDYNAEKLEVVVDIADNSSYRADIIWGDQSYAKKDDGIQMLGTVVSVPDKDGNFTSLVHESNVGTYAVRADLNVIWSMDKTGCVYIWSMRNGYSLADKMYDKNNRYVWATSTDGLLFRIDLESGELTKIIKNKEISFIGQDDTQIFVAIKNENLEYPAICMCDKKTGVVKQINRLPEINEKNKHLMTPQSNSLVGRECVIVARSLIDHINGNHLSEALFDKNNAIKFMDVLEENTLADIEVYFDMQSSDAFNSMKTTIISNRQTVLMPRIHTFNGMLTEELYKINDGEWRPIYTDSGILTGIDIPKDLDFDKEHILHIKAVDGSKNETTKSFRFTMENREVQWRIESGGRQLASKEVTEIETQDIVIECKENAANSVKEITYAFDNDPEVFCVQGERAEIKIPKKYLDGNEHKILIYFVSEKVTTKYYVYSFKYVK